MPPGTLKKIRPLHPNLVPPRGAEPAGVTDDGQNQLYTYTRKMARPVPLLECRECGNEYKGADGTDSGTEDKESPCCGVPGNRVWKVNRMTGEKVLKKNAPEIYEEHLLFYLESEGNGNVRMVQYNPPTEEEKRERERRLAVERHGDALIAELLESGITAETLRQWREEGMGPRAVPEDGGDHEAVPEPEVESDPAPEIPDLEYPHMHSPGRWYLTREHHIAIERDEDTWFEGNGEEAAEEREKRLAAEQARAEAREAAEATPTF